MSMRLPVPDERFGIVIFLPRHTGQRGRGSGGWARDPGWRHIGFAIDVRASGPGPHSRRSWSSPHRSVSWRRNCPHLSDISALETELV